MKIDVNLVGQNYLTNTIIDGINKSNRIKAAGEARQVLNDLFDRKIIRQGIYEREMSSIATTLGINLKEG